MNTTCITLVKEKIFRDGLSKRKAAMEIGVSHTTLARIIEGEPYDLGTAEKVASWLGVPVSNLLNANGSNEDGLAAGIAMILQREPLIAEELKRAIAQFECGNVSAATILDIAAYMAYRVNLSGLLPPYPPETIHNDQPNPEGLTWLDTANPFPTYPGPSLIKAMEAKSLANGNG